MVEPIFTVDSSALGNAQPNNDYIQDLGTRLLRNQPISIVPPNAVHDTVNYLQTQIADCIKKADYLQAQKIEDLCTALLQQNTKKGYIRIQNSKKNVLQNKLRMAKEELERAKEYRAEITNKYNIDRENAFKELEKLQDEELNKFDEEVYPNIPINFQKFSKEYLQLKKQEDFLVQSKRFVEANEIKMEADRIYSIEQEQQQERWKKHFESLREAFISKLDQQKLCLEQKWDGKWAEMLPPLVEEEARCIKAVKAAEAKIQEAEICQPKRGKSVNRHLPPMKIGPTDTNNTRMRIQNYTLNQKNRPYITPPNVKKTRL